MIKPRQEDPPHLVTANLLVHPDVCGVSATSHLPWLSPPPGASHGSPCTSCIRRTQLAGRDRGGFPFDPLHPLTWAYLSSVPVAVGIRGSFTLPFPGLILFLLLPVLLSWGSDPWDEVEQTSHFKQDRRQQSCPVSKGTSGQPADALNSTP